MNAASARRCLRENHRKTHEQERIPTLINWMKLMYDEQYTGSDKRNDKRLRQPRNNVEWILQNKRSSEGTQVVEVHGRIVRDDPDLGSQSARKQLILKTMLDRRDLSNS